ncbi:MAG: Flp1 family type IVb pilin [Lachnospiraceae bacterium]|nr:Flp1 family type IVb pilin [Lachnospiraceae bacterium]
MGELLAFWKEEDAVAVVEIILIVVVLIALVALFSKSLKEVVNKAISQITKRSADVLNI